MGGVSNVVRISRFKKIHIPHSPVRVEVRPDGSLALSFVTLSRPDIVCRRVDLPSWFVGKLAHLEERVSIFEPSEYGSRLDDNVFYINCE